MGWHGCPRCNGPGCLVDTEGTTECQGCGFMHGRDDRPKTPVIVVDLDRTLCNPNGRHPYDFLECDSDLVVEEVNVAVKALANHFRWNVIFLTGRIEEARERTTRWLIRHGWAYGRKGSRQPYDALFMRDNDDYRPGQEFKQDVLTNDIMPKYDVKLAFEDHDRTIAMMRSLGITVWAVAENAHTILDKDRP